MLSIILSIIYAYTMVNICEFYEYKEYKDFSSPVIAPLY